MPTNHQVYGFFPITDWLSRYNKEWLRPDVIAGLTTAAVVIPKAMAYATIAGLPVQVGLYTAFVPMIIYAVFGTALPLSVSTTTTIAILTASELGEVVPGGDPADLMRASATLTLLVGAILILAAWQLNPLAFYLSPLALAIVFFYSFTKRFTRWAHVVLGVAMGIAGSRWPVSSSRWVIRPDWRASFVAEASHFS